MFFQSNMLTFFSLSTLVRTIKTFSNVSLGQRRSTWREIYFWRGLLNTSSHFYFNLNSFQRTNRYSVFICTANTPWLNGKHVVFGKVTKGMNVVKKMEAYGTDMGKPRATVVISDCGTI